MARPEAQQLDVVTVSLENLESSLLSLYEIVEGADLYRPHALAFTRPTLDIAPRTDKVASTVRGLTCGALEEALEDITAAKVARDLQVSSCRSGRSFHVQSLHLPPARVELLAEHVLE